MGVKFTNGSSEQHDRDPINIYDPQPKASDKHKLRYGIIKK